MLASSHTVGLASPAGKKIPLKDITVRGSIVDLLSEIEICQTFENNEHHNIEAVYTFPLPLDSVVTDVSIELNGEHLVGTVIEKSDAEERYEESITDGNSAILLQQIETGLYVINVGNIGAGEKCIIKIRYAQAHLIDNGRIRVRIPTTLMPRYGDALDHGFAPHETPEYEIDVDYRMGMELQVSGLLKGRFLSSPSHSVQARSETDMDYISLKNISPDRDIILIFDQVPGNGCVATRYEVENEHMVSASFNPVFNDAQDTLGRAVKIAIDCSGSMDGDAISQCKIALEKVLSELRPIDCFNIMCFGSNSKMLFSRMMPVNDKTIADARTFAAGIDADMGGTEMRSALSRLYRLDDDSELEENVLLITDGGVYNAEQIVAEAVISGHRYFTVGVGHSVSERVVRQLATATGGVCDLVAPGEEMSDRIFRQFRRMFSARIKELDVKFPGSPSWVAGACELATYSGDTVHVHARYDRPPRGKVRLSGTLDNGSRFSVESPISPCADESRSLGFAKIAATARMNDLVKSDENQAKHVALGYSLLSKFTSFIVVSVREDAFDDIPAIRKVPMRLAHGFGSTAKLENQYLRSSGISPSVFNYGSIPPVLSAGSSAGFSETLGSVASPKGAWEMGGCYGPILNQTDSLDGLRSVLKNVRSSIATPEGLLIRLSMEDVTPAIERITIDALSDFGVPSNVVSVMRALVGEGFSEQDVIAAFRAALAKKVFRTADRGVTRAARQMYKNKISNTDLFGRILNGLPPKVAARSW